MRTSILLWSTVSGLVLGVFIDATLIGVALLLSALLPGVASRMHYKWLSLAAIVALAAIPLILGVLGYLEGQLKAV